MLNQSILWHDVELRVSSATPICCHAFNICLACLYSYSHRHIHTHVNIQEIKTFEACLCAGGEKKQQPQKLKQYKLLCIICQRVFGLCWMRFYWFSSHDSKVTKYSFCSLKRHPSMGAKGMLGLSGETGSVSESLCSYKEMLQLQLVHEETLKSVCIELVFWSVVRPVHYFLLGQDPLEYTLEVSGV